MKKIGFFSQVSTECTAYLKTEGFEIVSLNEETPIATCQNISGLLIRSQDRIDDSLLEKFPGLKVIATATSGFDHIDIKSCQARNIQLSFAPTANAKAAAELSLSFILMLMRGLPLHQSQLRAGQWRAGQRGFSLAGKALGIVGFGRAGQSLASFAGALGMEVYFCDPYLKQDLQNLSREISLTGMGLTELLAASDVVSLHVPLTRETKNLICRQTLEMMNPEAFLVNTSRGEVVVESELLNALDEGMIRGAALDVFCREPLSKSSKLLERSKLLLTPHIGAYTDQAFEASCHEAASNISYFFKNKGALLTPLPFDEEWFKASYIL